MKRLIILFSIVLLSTPVFGNVENLDELMERKARFPSATWDHTLLEDAANYYTWQPETLQYSDVTTGREVWRLTYAPNHIGGGNHDIAATHWSANGNRLMLKTTRPTQAYSFSTAKWFVINADGSKLKPARGSAAWMSGLDAYINWSPIQPDTIYQGNANDGQSTSPNILYKTVITDTSQSKTPYLTYPASMTRMGLKKRMSGDGSMMLVRDSSTGTYYPTRIYPEANKGILDADGYSQFLNFDWHWGIQPDPLSGYHDNYLSGAVNGIDGIWYFLMPEGAKGSFWRARMTGSGSNGEPVHIPDITYPYVWGDIEPVNTRSDSLAANDPWCPQGVVEGTDCQQYPGHVSPDRWGHYTVMEYGNYAPQGTAIHDARNHTHKYTYTAHKAGNHTDWEAWSDYVISDGADSLPYNGPSGTKRTYTFNYLTGDGHDVSFSHSNYNQGTTTAQSYLGPIQSPDGTKIQWVSSFLNTLDANYQAFWSVAYYPYPPEIKSATVATDKVRLTWDFNQGSSCAAQSTNASRSGPTPNFSTPKTYATRGWPHETSDCPPSPREIDKFRIWSSPDYTNWTPVGTANYNNCRAGSNNECGMWAESSWHYDVTQDDSTTMYYAVTSIEYSGLESRSLSNIWNVTTDGLGAISSQSQQAQYPTSPGAVSRFTDEYQAAANRYYNIYAEDVTTPTAIQQNRIASIPVTAADEYLDLLGNPDGTTKYIVTAVDSQGNESAALDSTAPHKLSPATADGQYTIAWTGEGVPQVPVDPEDPIDPEPTCFDGVRNGTETGVDCGGSCPPCEAPAVERAWRSHGASFGSTPVSFPDDNNQ